MTDMDKGTFIGVGVGPGDSEYLTLKALKIIRENRIIAVPSGPDRLSASYRIAAKAIPELDEDVKNNRKQLLFLPMPMKRDKDELAIRRNENAESVVEYLEAGENVVFLTLGDPNIYSTFSYLRDIVREMGYKIHTVAGVMSISAAAARLNLSLADWGESVRILPEGQMNTFDFGDDVTYVLMKPRGSLKFLRDSVKSFGKSAYAVTNCGMDNEKVYYSIDEIPENLGYFTIIFVK